MATPSKGVKAKYLKRFINWKDPEARRAYKRGWQRNLRSQCYRTPLEDARAYNVVGYQPLPKDYIAVRTNLVAKALQSNPEEGK